MEIHRVNNQGAAIKSGGGINTLHLRVIDLLLAACWGNVLLSTGFRGVGNDLILPFLQVAQGNLYLSIGM